MSKVKITKDKKEYWARYEIHRFYKGNKEVVEHQLMFMSDNRIATGKTLDDTVTKFKEMLMSNSDWVSHCARRT